MMAEVYAGRVGALLLLTTKKRYLLASRETPDRRTDRHHTDALRFALFAMFAAA